MYIYTRCRFKNPHSLLMLSPQAVMSDLLLAHDSQIKKQINESPHPPHPAPTQLGPAAACRPVRALCHPPTRAAPPRPTTTTQERWWTPDTTLVAAPARALP